jgi:hypothetical protein
MPHFAARRIALLLATLAAAPAHAQSPDLPAFRDSIGSIRDLLSLRRFTERKPVAGEGADALLRRGFAGLRLYELAGLDEDLRRARDAFEEAARREPALAWAHFGAGLTWSRDPELTGPAPRVVAGRAFAEALGRDARSRASRAFRRALDIDPGLTEAALALADLPVARRSADELAAARVALDRAVLEGHADARTSLALAEVANAQHDFGAALPFAERAAFAPDPPPAARYVLARTLLGGADRDAGAREYFAAIDGATPDVARRIYDDVRPVATEAEIAAWENADPDGRRAWLRSYWELRAALAGVDVPERIAEHYRRIDRALEFYPRRRRYGAPPSNALLLERPDLPFDDRGIVLLRHGEPVRIIRSVGGLQNESWVYPALEGGYRLLHFANYGSPGGSGGGAGDPFTSNADGAIGQGYAEYVLVYNLLCGPDYLADRILFDPRLRFASCDDFDRRSISAEVRRDALAALRTDSHGPDFAKRLPFVYDIFAFRGARGLTDLTAAIELPAADLQPTPSAVGTARAIRASFIVADTLDRRVTRIDTTLVVRLPLERERDAVVLALLYMPVVPGAGLAQRLVVRDAADSASGAMLGRYLDVPDFYGDSLMLSDVVLAAPGQDGPFRRGSASLRLVPTREYGGGAFDVFYEVYNLAPDRNYSTALLVERDGGGLGRSLKRLFGGGGPEVRLRFEGRARPESDGVVREVRAVETNLPPGRYRLRITVTDGVTGASVTRERPFTVVEPREEGS